MTGKAEGLGREKARGGWTPSEREVGFPRLSQWPRQAQGFYSSSTMSMGFGHQFCLPSTCSLEKESLEMSICLLLRDPGLNCEHDHKKLLIFGAE